MEAVIEELTMRHPEQKIQVVIGFSKQKDHTAMLHFLASHKHVRAMYPVTNKHFKIMGLDEMSSKIQSVHKLFQSFEQEQLAFREPVSDGDIGQTIRHALLEAQKHNDIVLICGSFYIMSDVREYLHFDDVFDHKEVNFN